MENEGQRPHYLTNWESSISNQWNKEQLLWIRDAHPSEIAGKITSEKEGSSIIWELLAHGNYQKAALIARETAQKMPSLRNEVCNEFGPEAMEMLFVENIMTLPRNLKDTNSYWSKDWFIDY